MDLTLGKRFFKSKNQEKIFAFEKPKVLMEIFNKIIESGKLTHAKKEKLFAFLNETFE